MTSPIQCLTLMVLSLTLNSAVAASAEDTSTNKTPAATASAKQPSKAPRVRITISKETTYITAPLRKDGYPDYVAALNERCSRGVTPENNAAVLFCKAFGPAQVSKPHRERFFKMLGIPPLPEEGEYFVDFGEHVKRLKKDGRLPSAQPGEDAEDAPWTEFRVSQERPWSANDFPAVADWLKANKRTISLLADAAKRPRYYAPAVSENVLLAIVELPTIQQSREVGRAMLSRAMLRIGAEKTDDAWGDVLACHRVARLHAQGPSLVDALVADAIDGMACSADQALLEHTRLSARQAMRMRDDLGQLPRVSRMADAVAFGERYMYLDCISRAARDGVVSLIEVWRPETPVNARGGKFLHPLINAVGREVIDWDILLIKGNRWYDRLAGAFGKTPRSQRKKEIDALNAEVRKTLQEMSGATPLVLSLLANPRRDVSRQLAERLLAEFMRTGMPIIDAEDRAMMRFEIIRLAFSLAAYRADRDSYPAKLADLVPKYADRVPSDVFTDGELHYNREDGGYVLYSVGPNGKDDGGRGSDDLKEGNEGWDDVVVRVRGAQKPEKKQ